MFASILHVDEFVKVISIHRMKYTFSRAVKNIAFTAAVITIGLAPLKAANHAAPYIDKTRIDQIEFGIFCDNGRTTRQAAPETTLGYIDNIVNEIVFANHGTIVPAQLGMNFGVKSSALGETIPDVLIKTRHPEFSVDGSTSGQWIGEITSGEPTYKGFGFDYQYEMVPGDWIMEAYKDGALLYSVTFTVVDPKTMPWLAQMCQGEAMLS